jgi:formylglycine-generating enzyme required for sulfatase activity
MDWDVFISHAWEDKEDIARPLAEALRRKGLRVWYDEFTLTLGDSLRRSIDRGLAQSRYGVVILSPYFFAKEWPQKELDGLAAREVSGEKVILPVWHNITADQVREYSPTLADRVAVSSDRGLEHVVQELLRVIKPTPEPEWELSKKWDKLAQPDQAVVADLISFLTAEVPTALAKPADRVRKSASEPMRPTIMERLQPFEPEMVRIPAGKFLMGTLEEDLWAIAKKYSIKRKYIAREIPRHRVFVQEFEIGKYPVTNFQYRAFVQDTGREPPGHWKGDKYPEGLQDHPVVSVSWYDAEDYCKWLSEKTGKSYRLPTEAEWEKAARGTYSREFPWGDEWDVNKCNTRESGTGTTTPVDQYSPDGDSPYGVTDMAGNVWEWCTDWLDAYKDNPFPDEDYGETYKVLRGGSWDHGQVGTRCAYRNWFEPRNRVEDVGFRCVRGSQ